MRLETKCRFLRVKMKKKLLLYIKIIHRIKIIFPIILKIPEVRPSLFRIAETLTKMSKDKKYVFNITS